MKVIEEKLLKIDSMLQQKKVDTVKNETATPQQIKEEQQCAAYTKKGKRCIRKAKEGSKYCGQHEFVKKKK